MLTKEQKEWVEARSDKPIFVVPYDLRAGELYEKVKKKIQNLLGTETVIEHSGASSLGISGQDEIDVSVVIRKDQFALYISKLEKEFGPVKSHYPDRARFEVKEEGKKIDLKIVDVNHPNYIQGKIFEGYLRKHPEDLERYRVLKETSSGLSVKEYYRKKIEFINEILSRAGMLNDNL